jgi:SSS family solute:Na+ symporter
MNSIVLAVLIYEILVIGGIGYYLSKKAKEGNDSFLLSGRDLPVVVVGITLALTVLGSAHIFGLMETAWHLGAVSMWFSFSHVILITVVCLGTGRWVRRLNVSTVPELVEMLFGSKVRILVACVMAPSIFGLLTMETQAIGVAFASMTGWSIQKGALIGGIIGIFYVVLMKEVAWVNLVNTIVMYIGMIVAAFSWLGACRCPNYVEIISIKYR